MSSRLFGGSIRQHIYAIYGLVRIADEVVDTYTGKDKAERLDDLQQETTRAMADGYSTNPIVHAFALTARKYKIGDALLAPFFASMRTDVAQTTFTTQQYEDYIYGSAEVVGLMCLRVFVDGDDEHFALLREGACALGSAYQKVNFLRDIKADHDALGRVYFPGVSYREFNDEQKTRIIADIERDFSRAEDSMKRLPNNARAAVKASYYYYSALLHELKLLPAHTVLSRRVRVANWRKIALLLRARMGL